MGANNFLIVGGSSGIGLEIFTELEDKGDEIYVGSRSSNKLADLSGIHHLPLDVTEHPVHLEGLPDVLNGLVYCPGTIRLKPFHLLTRDEFLEDLQISFLGAVQVIQTSLPNLRQSPTGASILLFNTVAVETGMAFPHSGSPALRRPSFSSFRRSGSVAGWVSI